MHLARRSIREARGQEPSARWLLTFFFTARFGGRVSWMLKHALRSYSRDDFCLEFPRQAFARFGAASGCGQPVSSSFVLFFARVLARVPRINQSCVYAHIWARNFSSARDSCYWSSRSDDPSFDRVTTLSNIVELIFLQFFHRFSQGFNFSLVFTWQLLYSCFHSSSLFYRHLTSFYYSSIFKSVKSFFVWNYI